MTLKLVKELVGHSHKFYTTIIPALVGRPNSRGWYCGYVGVPVPTLEDFLGNRCPVQAKYVSLLGILSKDTFIESIGIPLH